MLTTILVSSAAAVIIGLPAWFTLWGKMQECLRTHEKEIDALKTEMKEVEEEHGEIRSYVSMEVRAMNDLGWKRELESAKKLNEMSERVIKIEADTSYIKTMLDKIYAGRCQD